MEYTCTQATRICRQLLKPYAAAMKYYVGLNPVGNKFELMARCIVHLPDGLALKGLVDEDLPDGPIVCTLGNEADFSIEFIGAFLEAKGRDNRFQLGCGFNSLTDEDGSWGVDNFFVELTDIAGVDIHARFSSDLRSSLAQ